ncbi:MAG TPA: methylmalonyl Co-A mutase-associated GTPase MeaB, partial [Methylomirabilota bacterium]|nr:methylmalonyl Co-A mutase-associated GTPase MeaB [Methylomirabilota bacterium]
RRTRAAAQVRAILTERLAERLADEGLAPLTASLVDEVAEHRVDPYTAADRLLEALLRRQPRPGA